MYGDRILCLPHTLSECPGFWQNFARYVNPHLETHDKLTREDINRKFGRILRQDYNASYLEPNNTGDIIFDTESDLWAFKTYWSDDG